MDDWLRIRDGRLGGRCGGLFGFGGGATDGGAEVYLGEVDSVGG